MSVCVWGGQAGRSAQAHAYEQTQHSGSCVGMLRSEEDIGCPNLSLSLPYSLEAGSLTEPWTRLSVSKSP